MKESASRPLRLLVVDDNEDTSASLGFLFQIWGHAVRIVSDGPAAIEAACEFRPDAVILDIGLPRMDGFEVARRLRSLPGFDRTFIVASSGFSSEKHRRLATEAGIDTYLVKPFDPFSLEQILASHASSSAEALPA